MSGSDGSDTLRTDLDELAEGLPPMRPLPAGFGTQARRRRGARLAAAGTGLTALAAGAGLAIVYAVPAGRTTLHVPPVGGSASVSAATPRQAAGPSTVAPVAPASGTPACSNADLAVSVANDGAAAGSTYYALRFHNRSAVRCTLTGYPGVSFVSGPNGGQIGAAASRNAVSPARTLTLGAGATDAALLQVGEPYNYPSSRCGSLVHAAGLRVYPPGDRGAVFVALPLQVCSSQVGQLTVSTVVANTTGQP